MYQDSSFLELTEAMDVNKATLAQIDTFIAADGQTGDSNKAAGKINIKDPVLGSVHVEYQRVENGSSFEAFVQTGNSNQGSTTFIRKSPIDLDVITVSSDGSGLADGATHISYFDPVGSFATY